MAFIDKGTLWVFHGFKNVKTFRNLKNKQRKKGFVL